MITDFKKQPRILWYLLAFVLQGLLFVLPGIHPEVSADPYAGPLYAFTGISEWLPIWRIILSFILIYSTGVLADQLLSLSNIYIYKNALPLFFWVLFCCIYPGFIYPGAAHLSLFLLLGGMAMIFRMHNTKYSLNLSFLCGVLFAVSGLLYMPSILFVLFTLSATASIKPFRLRDWISTLLGCSAVFLYTAMYYYFTDTPPLAFRKLPGLQPPEGYLSIFRTGWSVWILVALSGGLMNLALLNIFNDYNTFKIFSRRVFLVCILMPIFVLLQIILTAGNDSSFLLYLCFPFAVLCTQLFLDLRNPRAGYVILILILLAVFYAQWDYYYGKIITIKLVH
jgi:hypothetical protein